MALRPPPRTIAPVVLDRAERVADIPRLEAGIRHHPRRKKVRLPVMSRIVREEIRGYTKVLCHRKDVASHPPADGDGTDGPAGNRTDLESLAAGRLGRAVAKRHMAYLVSQ